MRTEAEAEEAEKAEQRARQRDEEARAREEETASPTPSASPSPTKSARGHDGGEDESEDEDPNYLKVGGITNMVAQMHEAESGAKTSWVTGQRLKTRQWALAGVQVPPRNVGGGGVALGRPSLVQSFGLRSTATGQDLLRKWREEPRRRERS